MGRGGAAGGWPAAGLFLVARPLAGPTAWGQRCVPHPVLHTPPALSTPREPPVSCRLPPTVCRCVAPRAALRSCSTSCSTGACRRGVLHRRGRPGALHLAGCRATAVERDRLPGDRACAVPRTSARRARFALTWHTPARRHIPPLCSQSSALVVQDAATLDKMLPALGADDSQVRCLGQQRWRQGVVRMWVRRVGGLNQAQRASRRCLRSMGRRCRVKRAARGVQQNTSWAVNPNRDLPRARGAVCLPTVVYHSSAVQITSCCMPCCCAGHRRALCGPALGRALVWGCGGAGLTAAHVRGGAGPGRISGEGSQPAWEPSMGRRRSSRQCGAARPHRMKSSAGSP